MSEMHCGKCGQELSTADKASYNNRCEDCFSESWQDGTCSSPILTRSEPAGFHPLGPHKRQARKKVA